jgi:hypothetical protein
MTSGKLIAIYCLSNAFLAGYHLGQSLPLANTRRELIKIFCQTFLTSIFGLFFIASEILGFGAEALYKWLNSQTQIKFWLEFYLTSKYDKVDQEVLERENQKGEKRKDSQKLKDKIFCLAIKKLNARNNYTHAHKPE